MKNSNTQSRLKKIMEERDLKQIDVVHLCEPYCKKYNVKFNKSDLSQYLSGKTVPNQDKLYILCNALKVSEAWLMGFDVIKDRTENYQPPSVNFKNLNNLNETLATLKDNELEVFFDIVKNAYDNRIADLDFDDNTANLDLKDSILNLLNEIDYIGQSKVFSYIQDLLASKLYVINREQVLTLAEDQSAPILHLPHFDIKASAGFGSYLDDKQDQELKPYPLNEITRKADHAIQIKGDSMYPLINDGDTVFVQEQPMVNNGEVGIFVYDGEVYCKRLIQDGKKIILRSENNVYEDKIIDLNYSFVTVGKVLL